MAIPFRRLFAGKSAAPPPEPTSQPAEEPVVRDPDEVVNILIWGPQGCGKSSFVGGWFYADRPKWKIRENDDATLDYRMGIMDCIRNGDFTFPTSDARITYLSFTFEYEGWFRTEPLTITVPECAGEKFAQMDDELLNRLDEYDGVVWLVDPVRAWEEQQWSKDEYEGLQERLKEQNRPRYITYRQMLQKWLNAFFRVRPKRARGNPRMAFCLTKMDHPDHVTWINNPEKHLNTVLGEDAISVIRDHIGKNDYKVFASSLPGLDENGVSNAVHRSSVSRNQIVTTVGTRLNCRPKPFGVFQPLEWIIGR